MSLQFKWRITEITSFQKFYHTFFYAFGSVTWHWLNISKLTQENAVENITLRHKTLFASEYGHLKGLKLLFSLRIIHSISYLV